MIGTDPTPTTIDLDAIRARANAATPGPWGVGNGTNIVRGLEVTGRSSYTCIQSVAEIGDDRCCWDRDEAVEVDPEADAEFIANSRQDVADLLAEVDRLRAERDALWNSTKRYAEQSATHRHERDAARIKLAEAEALIEAMAAIGRTKPSDYDPDRDHALNQPPAVHTVSLPGVS